MMVTTTVSFPTVTVTLIASPIISPSYATICITQTELSRNTASIHSNSDSDIHGHLALTIPPAEYSTITTGGHIFDAPVNPPIAPVHPPGATAPQITEINRQHKEDQAVFYTYYDVDQALLCNQ
jgi:hypothetical protein